MRKDNPIHEARQIPALHRRENVRRAAGHASYPQCFQSRSPERFVPGWRTARRGPLILIALTLLDRINLRYYL